MAVVVQSMIESEISGVSFSVHPVTQERNTLVIEAVWGLGEAIVSGQVTPDSYMVDKKTHTITHKTVTEQKQALQPTETARADWKPVAPSKQSHQKLSDIQIQELAHMVVKIEKHFGFPVDVEWAYQGNTLFILQSRPITTLT